MDFKKYNKYLGWALFAISAIVYLSTMEGSVSLWDCGEYIATSNKLEVGHPPGAPLFMMVNRLFSAFVPGDTVACIVNSVSAICSAFTILFLFWTITAITEKLAFSNANLGSLFKKSPDSSVEENKKTPLSEGQKWAILGSGIVGALVYTFTDSFWFSAVEAEVYAMSSFFTALVFWAIYKWEQSVDALEENPEDAHTRRNPDYWLVFIFFMIGLSIGVHLLNLLAVPAVAYAYYFKKFKKTTLLGFILTGIIGLASLQIIQEVIIPRTISWAAGFEIYFTNSAGMPFGTGTILFGLLLISVLMGGLIISKRKGLINLNTAFLSLTMLYVGYSCFAMIPIRSNADLPIDENNPENLVSFNSYLLREQYGDWPLFSGPQFNSKRSVIREEYGDRSPVYKSLYVVKNSSGKAIDGFISEKEAQQYIEDKGLSSAEIRHEYYLTQKRENEVPAYQDGHTVIFPRMHSDKAEHIEEYKKWSGYPSDPKLEGREGTSYMDQSGRPVGEIYLPTIRENMGYFFDYQINHMFLRYFLWNFSGRQNDDHNQRGGILNGNWQSGINFIDQEFIGDQSKLPEHRASNYANNKYYLLPLILGLIGLFYQLYRNWKDWFTVLLLFLFTGFMIVIYLNQKPLEPRERDYAYAGAFYAFAMWIGLSVYAIYDLARSINWKGLAQIMVYPLGAGIFFLLIETMNNGSHVLSYSVLYMSFVAAAVIALSVVLKNVLKQDKQHALAVLGILLVVPLIMGFQNWNDHDRSGRYTPREMAKNYLKVCAPQAIIFTNGDNDTFPLWYIQEVEEYRTDVRNVNLSLANTSWYVEQMTRQMYDSKPLPISFSEHEYREGKNMDYAKTFKGLLNEFKQQIKYLSISISRNSGGDIAGTIQRYADNSLKGGPAKVSQALLQCAKYNPVTMQNTINQVWNELKQPENGFTESNPSLISTIDKYAQSGDYAPELKKVIREIKEAKYTEQIGDNFVPYIPYSTIKITVDKAKVKANDVVPKSMYNEIQDVISFKLSKSTLYKADILILDLISGSDWERPIYFAGTAGRATYLGLQDYFLAEGLVYRFAPIKSNSPFSNINIFGRINTEKMYDMAMNKWDWGNLGGDGIYADYYNRRPVSNFRLQYHVLAKSLITEGNPVAAVEVLNKSLDVFPDNKIPFDNFSGIYVDTYMDAYEALIKNGDNHNADIALERAKYIAEKLQTYVLADMNWFATFRWDLFVHNESVEDVSYTIFKHYTMDLQRIETINAKLDELSQLETSEAKTIATGLTSILDISMNTHEQLKTQFFTKWNDIISKMMSDIDEDDTLIAKRKLAVEEYIRIFNFELQNKFQLAMEQEAVKPDGVDIQNLLMTMKQIEPQIKALTEQRQDIINQLQTVLAPYAADLTAYTNVISLAKFVNQTNTQDPAAGRTLELMTYFGL